MAHTFIPHPAKLKAIAALYVKNTKILRKGEETKTADWFFSSRKQFSSVTSHLSFNIKTKSAIIIRKIFSRLRIKPDPSEFLKIKLPRKEERALFLEI